jgi:metal-responsive CopG/Arc/MetJ family transcriptional regulator
MRTTVVLDDDVVAALDRLRREKGLGLSEALNELVRSGLHQREPRPRAPLEASDLGLRIDVSNVAEALDFAEGG